jgi:hypothetical protein
MLILVIAALGIIGAGAAGVVADVRLDNVTTANCREIEKIKGYVRLTVARSSRLRDNLDFSLSARDLEALKAQDRETLRRFRSEPCPRTTD